VRAPSLFFPMTPVEQWDGLALTLAHGTDPDRFAYSIRYRYEGFVYEATVGEPRHRQAIMEDKRGLLALLKRGEQLGRREDSGNMILAIVRDNPWRIYERVAGPSPWPNPFHVASTEIEAVVDFSPADVGG
jgi:hypothetical protein